MKEQNKELFAKILHRIDKNLYLEWFKDDYVKYNIKIEGGEYDGGVYVRAIVETLGHKKLLAEVAILSELIGNDDYIKDKMSNFCEAVDVKKQELSKFQDVKNDHYDSSKNLYVEKFEAINKGDDLNDDLYDEYGVKRGEDDYDDDEEDYDDYDDDNDDYDDYDNDYNDGEDDW